MAQATLAIAERWAKAATTKAVVDAAIPHASSSDEDLEAGTSCPERGV